MKAGSHFVPTFIANPTVVEVKNHPRPIFKPCLHIATLYDFVGAFLHVLEGVINVEDVRAYIYFQIEDLGTSIIKIMYMNKLMGNFGKIKPKYKHIEELGFTGLLDIPKLEDEII